MYRGCSLKHSMVSAMRVFSDQLFTAVQSTVFSMYYWQFRYLNSTNILKLVVCILLRVLGQVQGFRLTQHWFEYFIQ
jgi:hypothetical protein